MIKPNFNIFSAFKDAFKQSISYKNIEKYVNNICEYIDNNSAEFYDTNDNKDGVSCNNKKDKVNNNLNDNNNNNINNENKDKVNDGTNNYNNKTQYTDSKAITNMNISNTIKSDNKNILFFFALISFHHKLGAVVEKTYPEKEEILEENKDILEQIGNNLDKQNNNIKKNSSEVLEFILNKLTVNCLTDGLHLIPYDNYIFFISNEIYCVNSYIQIRTSSNNEIEDSFQENIRNCIQKSLCIVCSEPIFVGKNLYVKLAGNLNNEMYKFSLQKSLNDKYIIEKLFLFLRNYISKYRENVIKFNIKKAYIDFNIVKAFLMIKDHLLTILKLILLKKNIVIFSKIPSNSAYIIICILSLFPELIRNGNKINDFHSQNGMPFDVDKEYLIMPVFSLQNLDSIKGNMNNNNDNTNKNNSNNTNINSITNITNNSNKNSKSFLVGTSNLLICSSPIFDVSLNIDENKIEIKGDLNDNLTEVNSEEKNILKRIDEKIDLFFKQNKEYFKEKYKCKIKENSNDNNIEINFDNNIDKKESNKVFILMNKKSYTKEREFYLIDEENVENNIIKREVELCDYIRKEIYQYYYNILYDCAYILNIIEQSKKINVNEYLINEHKNILRNYKIKYCFIDNSTNNTDEASNINNSNNTDKNISNNEGNMNISNNKINDNNENDKIKTIDGDKTNNTNKNDNSTNTSNVSPAYELFSLVSLRKQYIFYRCLALEKNKTFTQNWEDFGSNLSKVNILCFFSEFIKSDFFKMWKSKYNKDIKYLSVLNVLLSPQVKLYFDTSVLYIGTLFHGKMYGKGSLSDTEKGEVYVGDFVNGYKHGKGTLSIPSKNILYDGDFKYNLYDGIGTLTDNETVKKGEFKKGEYKEKKQENKGKKTDKKN